jgi:formylglycine-generating enzyme required for sulfatase activity
VTYAHYREFMQATGHKAPRDWTNRTPPPNREDHPVVDVSWHDAKGYCQWLSEVTGKDYHLPSEAEWEKGARGTDGRIYPWGNQWDATRCNSAESKPFGTTSVYAYPQGASPYGLLDMAGNVWEWTRSLWGKIRARPDYRYPYRPTDGRENLAAGYQELRVLRGGAFFNGHRCVRCAYRYWREPHNDIYYVGFRVVMHPSF